MQTKDMISFIIDRIEGPVAVVEYGGQTYDLPLVWFPADVVEGTVWTFKLTQDLEDAAALTQRVRDSLGRLDAGPLGEGDKLDL